MQKAETNTWAVQSTLIAAMAIWGLNVPVVKFLTTILDPIFVAALRMMVAGVALSFILLWKHKSLPSFSLRQGIAIVICATLMVYLNQILFAEGLLRTTATNGALIMALSPLVSALIAAIAFRERITMTRLVGVALGFIGVTSVVLSHPGAGLSNAGLGDLILVVSVISFASGGAIVQRLSLRVHTLTISWAIYMVGALMLGVHAGFVSPAWSMSEVFVGWRPIACILYSGVMATAICNLVWNGAIARIGIARTSIFFYWVPVFGVAFAALLLGEELTSWHFFGFIAVMCGTYLGTRRAAPSVPISM